MVDLKMLNNEEKQVKKEGPIKPTLNSKLRRVWQKKVASPLEAPLMEAPPQESSSTKVNREKTHVFL
jgi:1,2-phenylacetyl-CoA epoxidase catalytic subunit